MKKSTRKAARKTIGNFEHSVGRHSLAMVLPGLAKKLNGVDLKAPKHVTIRSSLLQPSTFWKRVGILPPGLIPLFHCLPQPSPFNQKDAGRGNDGHKKLKLYEALFQLLVELELKKADQGREIRIGPNYVVYINTRTRQKTKVECLATGEMKHRPRGRAVAKKARQTLQARRA